MSAAAGLLAGLSSGWSRGEFCLPSQGPGSKPAGMRLVLHDMHSALCGGPGMMRFSTKAKAALLALHAADL